MSDQIKHECGIALIRLLKPLSFYKKKYGTETYGLEKLSILMEKQHNRGQEGAGVACIKINSNPGKEYLFRERALGESAITQCFADIYDQIKEGRQTCSICEELPFIGEIYLGHLRYSTTGRGGLSYVHPFVRRNNWRTRTLSIAGNFNITNEKELLSTLVDSQGQHPRSDADTFLMLEQMGALLDDHHTTLYKKFRAEGLKGEALNHKIEESIEIEGIIEEVTRTWDGGFTIIGATGSGESFMFRDRWGIRPCFYYSDDEIFIAASERAVIQTTINVEYEEVSELAPGEMIVISRNGTVRKNCYARANNPQPCSFERIYFSRGSDADIYKERKRLGELLTSDVLSAIPSLEDTVFSYIPNTAEVAFYGLVSGINEYLKSQQSKRITALVKSKEEVTPSKVEEILSQKVRIEKLAIKDMKMRTFITQESNRTNMVAHVYDITYKSIEPHKDTIAVIDDSIVRGTTLKYSIVNMLSRLNPKEIIIISSAPQIRYPDCYGIDMSCLGDFVAFVAAIELLKERDKSKIIEDIYKKCKAVQESPLEDFGSKIPNYVKEVYEEFSDEEITNKIAQLITPQNVTCKVKVVFQSIENLHKACPQHTGDWYFSGNYPTPGGVRCAIQSFINFYEGNASKRGYGI